VAASPGILGSEISLDVRMGNLKAKLKIAQKALGIQFSEIAFSITSNLYNTLSFDPGVMT
jgi:hypothetical protein